MVTTIITLSATIAVIGLLLLAVVAARTAWASRKMAKSIRQTTAIARTVGLSVVSKNKNDILSA